MDQAASPVSVASAATIHDILNRDDRVLVRCRVVEAYCDEAMVQIEAKLRDGCTKFWVRRADIVGLA